MGLRGSVHVVFAVNRLCRATPATSPRIFNVKEFLSDFLPCYANDHVHFISCWFARCSLGEVNNGSYPIPIPGIPSPRCHIRQHMQNVRSVVKIQGTVVIFIRHRKLVHTSNFGFISLHLSKGLTIFYFLKNLGKPGCLDKKNGKLQSACTTSI